jgi:nicotinamide mononucleotide transporter
MQLSYTELIAALLGIASIYLLIRRNVWAFPIGIVMVLLYAYIFFQAKFYSDMALQGVYVVMQAQGWYAWTRGGAKKEESVVVRWLRAGHWGWITAFVVLATGVLGYTMSRLTDAALPWVDAFTTSLSLAAQWCLNQRYIENWMLWIVVNTVYLYQYSAKELYLTTGLYAIFWVMAILGYKEWRKNGQLIIDN